MRFGVTLGGGQRAASPPGDGEDHLALVPSYHPGGVWVPSPSPLLAGVSPLLVSPRGGSALSPRSLQHCACRQGPAAAPTRGWGPPVPPPPPPWGWGVKNRFAPVPRGLPGPLHIRGDAGSMAGEGFPLSRLAAASIEPWKSWVFGEHRCLPTLGMPRSPQPHGPQWGCWHLGTEYPWQPFPTWLLRPFPVTVHHPRVDFPASASPVSTAGAFALPALLPYISPSPFTRKYWPACSSWQPHLQWNCIRHLH